MTQFYPFDECSQAFIDEENNLWSYDGVQWFPRIGDPRMARKKKEQERPVIADEWVEDAVIVEDVYPDNVVRPKHYTDGRKHEPWDVINDWGLDYFLGNALKYISRAGRKADTREDIQKAITYLQKKLELLK